MTKATQPSNLISLPIQRQDGYDSEEEVGKARCCFPTCLRSATYVKNNQNRVRNTPVVADVKNDSLDQALQLSLVFQEPPINSLDISASTLASNHAFKDPSNLPDIRPESSIHQGHESSPEVEDLAFSDAQKIWLFDYIVNQRNLRDREINSRSPSPKIEEDLTDEQKIRAFDFIASSSQNNMDENGLKRYLNLGDFSDDQLPIDLRSQDCNSSGSEASRPMSFFETKQLDFNTYNDSDALIGSNIAISLDQEQLPIAQNAQHSEIIKEESEITPTTPNPRNLRPTLPSVRLAQVLNLPTEDPNFPNDLKIKAFNYINEVAKLGFDNLDEVGKVRRFNAATHVINTHKGMIKTAETFAGRILTSSLGNSSALNDEEKVKLFDFFNKILEFKITDTPQARIDKLQRLMKTIYSNKKMIREKLDRRIAKDDGTIPTNRSRQI